MKKYILLVLPLFILAILASTEAFAVQIDVPAIALEKLKKTAAAKNAAGGVLAAVVLKGDLRTTGIKFKMPSVVPEKPLVLTQQNVINCDPAKDMSTTVSVNKSTTNTESFSKSTTLGGETSLTVSYDSPFGAGGSGTTSFNYSSTETTQTAKSETLTWAQSYDVPLGPMQSKVVQFVVSQATLNNVPWTTTIILAGPAELTYGGKAEVCVFSKINYAGNKKCRSTDKKLATGSLSKIPWDSGAGNLGDGVKSIKINQGARVEFYKTENHTSLAGYLVNDMANMLVLAGKSLILIPPGVSEKKTVQLETYLNTEALSRIPLSGTFNGVNGVQGDFRAGYPTTLTKSDCGATGTNKTVEQPASNTAPVAGTVLKSGFKPVKKP